MALLERYLKEAIRTMERDKIRMRVLGDVTPLSDKLKDLIAKTNEISTHYEGFQANICLNYGGRGEILHAVRELVRNYMDTGALPEETDLESHLWSAGIPDPELLIRPGGELRLSNFLLWQAAYSELYFTDVLWPDFTEEDLDRAIDSYRGRQRRFGGLIEE